ncbi:MAG TPA: cytochrome c [Polyangiaceae bacterium]|nr:cytochrome c [Polyangiaceae bacterium]
MKWPRRTKTAPTALVPIGHCALMLACSQGPSSSDTSDGAAPRGTATTTPTATTGSTEPTTTGVGPSTQIDFGDLLDGRVDNQAAVPIAGGTLTVTPDGAYAVAADADRARIFVVKLADRSVAEVAMPAGAEPGRVIAGRPPLLYALGRRSGALYSIDPISASVTREVHVCAAPRGLAYDSATAKVHVTCHSGKLLTLDAQTLDLERELALDVDLRDVVVTGTQLLVSRFRSAEVLLLSEDGELVSRFEPDPFHGCARATALYRMALSADQILYLSHQASGLDELGTNAGGYGNSCFESSVMPITTALPLQNLPGWEGAPIDPTNPAEATRSAISHAAYDLDLTTQTPPETPTTTFEPTHVGLGLAAGVPFRYLAHGGATGPFDVAASAQGEVAQLLTGNTWKVSPANLWRSHLGPAQPGTSASTEASESAGTTQYWEPGTRLRAFGEPVAVAFTPEGKLIVQSREPAALQFEDGSVVELSRESHANTGHAMFHMTAGVGISCASCHPEGSEDGHTWAFPQGLRRTQPLNGGVLQRAPFHWNGELESIQALVGDVLLSRMGMQERVSVDQAHALASWLDSIPNVPVEPSNNPEAVSRGRALFEAASVGCSHCHTGAAYADNRAYDVGTGMLLFTPTLLGVGTRQPLMHDGCAQSLEARFGLCGGEGDRHGIVSHLDEAQTADLVEFLRTL